jgi:hypothetical protein
LEVRYIKREDLSCQYALFRIKDRVSEIAKKAEDLKQLAIEDQYTFIRLQVEMTDSFRQQVLDGNQADARFSKIINTLVSKGKQKDGIIGSPKVQFVLCGSGDDIAKWLLVRDTMR